jgi:hypothetical protein
MNIPKEWVMGIVSALIVAILSWVGTTLVGLETKVAALEATQDRLIETSNKTLDALIEELQQ